MDNIASFWQEKWKHESKNPVSIFAKRITQFIQKNIHKDSIRVLDLWAWLGEDASYFLQNGFYVTASDFVDTCLVRIPSHKNLHKKVIDIKSLPTDLSEFDVIYAHLSIHYFDNVITSKIFENLFNSMKEWALLCVKCKSIDDMLAIKWGYVGNGLTNLDGKLYHFFSLEEMGSYAKNFEIIRLRKTSSKYKNYKSSFIELVARK